MCVCIERVGSLYIQKETTLSAGGTSFSYIQRKTSVSISLSLSFYPAEVLARVNSMMASKGTNTLANEGLVHKELKASYISS